MTSGSSDYILKKMETKPFRWCYLSAQPSKERFEALSEYLNQQGHENTLELIETDESRFLDDLKRVKQEFDQIRLGSPVVEKLFEDGMDFPSELGLLKTADALLKEPDGRWWPRSFLREIFASRLNELAHVDVREAALIVGSGVSARAITGALIQLGYSRINFAEKFKQRVDPFVEVLGKNFFGHEILAIPPSMMTTIPGIHSIIVNTSPFIASNDLLMEMYYLNFLTHGGLVVDCTLFPVETPLLKAATKLKMQIIHGFELAALTDIQWAQNCLKTQLDGKHYGEFLKTRMENVPFDMSLFGSHLESEQDSKIKSKN